jgi:alkylation response protein AidB-like acyl-CoA dehydrogenase
MPFAATPLIPGDLFDSAARLAKTSDTRLALLADVPARAALLATLWDEAFALGWPAVMIPEDQGGAGGSLEDLVAIIDGAGRAALPLPLAATCGVLPVMLPDAAAAQVLPYVASGAWRVAPAFAMLQRDPRQPGASANAQLRLTGALIGLEAPPGSTHLLLQCPVDGVPSLLLLPTDGLPLRHFERLDGRPSIDVALDGVTLPASALLARGEAVAAAASAAQSLGALLVCVEAVAAMGVLIEQVVDYLSNRIQFGETLSRFQVLRHATVDLYTRQEAARAMVLELVARPSNRRSLHLAKLHLGRVSRSVAQDAIQLHGGMGLTDELPASRMIKRLLTIEFDFGDQTHHAAKATVAD